LGTVCGLARPTFDHVLDAQPQAEAYNLPGSLDKAAKALRTAKQKDVRGKRLINTLCDGNKEWAPKEGDLDAFWSYAVDDTLTLREIWRRCRPLTGEEWHDYHVVERMNQNGLAVDVAFAKEAVEWARYETESLNKQLRELTGDPGISLSHSVKKIAFVEKLVAGTPLETSLLVTKKERGKGTRQALSLDKSVQAELRERVPKLVEESKKDVLIHFLDLLEAGNGVATKKFKKIAESAVGGRVYGQYKYNGAGQTGRLSSRGIQLQNVIRDSLVDPLETIDCIMGVGAYGAMSREWRVRKLEEWHQLPFQKILSRLIRPTIIAPEGQVLVWGDWVGIEGRVLPWLAGDQAKLDKIASGVDMYCEAAKAIYGYEVKKGMAERQIGKVSELALGYGGGVGAFQSMAKGFGIKVSDDKAEDIKQKWRNANSRIVSFWHALSEAATIAMDNPGVWVRAGAKIRYLRSKRDLYCQLPCGRVIAYPEVRREQKYKEAWDKVIDTITYRKVLGANIVRGDLWAGLAAENLTQAASASLLRWAMREIDKKGYKVVLTTHDEVGVECPDEERGAALRMLKGVMTTNPPWADGLPLAADVTSGYSYGKA